MATVCGAWVGADTGRLARSLVRLGSAPAALARTRAVSPTVRPMQPLSVQTSIASCSPATLRLRSAGSTKAVKAEPRIPTVAVGVCTL
ncbi:hypothetical protein ASE76_07855 [Xylophilus sp. Leaf220]|nr:hypothetical protein ASE76_07855 [Xylophilus sp. Leaf220]